MNMEILLLKTVKYKHPHRRTYFHPFVTQVKQSNSDFKLVASNLAIISSCSKQSSAFGSFLNRFSNLTVLVLPQLVACYLSICLNTLRVKDKLYVLIHLCYMQNLQFFTWLEIFISQTMIHKNISSKQKSGFARMLTGIFTFFVGRSLIVFISSLVTSLNGKLSF